MTPSTDDPAASVEPGVAISVRGVSKCFQLSGERPSSLKELLLSRTRNSGKQFWALNDVTLDIPKGSFFGFIGHNGSGKSTLLRLMAGIHRTNGGTITVDGRISALLELGSGFHPDLTGRENIYLNGAILGIPQNEMAQSVEKIIDFSGLGEFIDTPIKAYSSGMYVRLGFAVAVNVNPEILLVDEVIAVGDEDFQRRCLDHMYELRRKGVTIVFVSHAIGMVQSLCDTVAWMDHGELQLVGEPAEVCQAYLSHVNQMESDRLTSAQDQETQDQKDRDQKDQDQDPTAERRGSGEVIISHVEILNIQRDVVLSVVQSGIPPIIRLWYEASERTTDLVFGVGINHESGVLISKFFTPVIEALEAGKGYMDIEFPDFPLLSGNFYISTLTQSADHLHTFDEFERAVKLLVQPGDSGVHEGLVYLNPVSHVPVPHEV